MPVLTLHDSPPKSSARVGATIIKSGSDQNSPIPPLAAKSPVANLQAPEEMLTSKFPIAKMDTESITNSIAARLTSMLLGHVLFLKNQVPFPVLQLGKMPAGKSSTRAIKHRQEMLTSFDTICSHLDTTFSALSTAMARCSASKNEITAQIYMAILVGPSLSTPKSKVILGIDGLEKRIWGTRADIPTQLEEDSQSEEDGSSEESADEDDDGLEHPDDSEEEEEGEGEETDEEEQEVGDDDDEDEGNDITRSIDVDATTQQVQPAKLSPVSICPPADYISPAEQEKLLKSADRLLSRTLASADAVGNGFFSEISPTQTHVLLRAPRRFDHPAWIPRQNVMSSLNTSLSDFLDGTVSSCTQTDTVDETSVKNYRTKNKTEGIWITTRRGIRSSPPLVQSESPTSSSQEELDDMIWWSWDGKFVGFADW